MTKSNSKKENKNKLSTILFATAGVFVASFFSSKYMVNYAINRKQPDPITKSRKSHHKPTIRRKFYTEMAVKGKELEEIPHKTIEIEAKDSTLLKGHLFIKENAKRTIIAVHGWRSNWNRDFAFVGKFLLNEDNNVLFVEQRGQNNSEGEYMSLGLNERFDCLEWIKWVNEYNHNDMPIYLYGISMGATSVLMSSGFDLPDNVKGIIADCGFTSPEEISNYVVHHKMHMLYGLKKIWSEEIFKHRTHLKMDEYSTLEAMKTCKTPILFIHGQEDNFVPVSMTYENYQKCKCDKELLVIPNAGHAMSYFINPQKYEEYLKSFWDKND